MAFASIEKILLKLKQKYPSLDKKIQESSALGQWEQAVGPKIAKHTEPKRIEKNVLWVIVDHPIWKTELHHRKNQILALLNKDNTTQIKDILFLDKRA